SHALRIHLQNPDIRAGSIHPKPDPTDAGTEQLGLGYLRPVRIRLTAPAAALNELRQLCAA
ncbi:hypothetical protein, partial [Tabrizicola sp.]|uniref:hypothetical protein n=1 Tax=Tabrizicola sp. TaxID=2005166 RepID=UPI00286B2C80